MLKKTHETDPELYGLVVDELHRQEHNIEMIASESAAPLEVMELSGSIFTNKRLEGYPGKRFQAGSDVADKVEVLGVERAKELFKADHLAHGSAANWVSKIYHHEFYGVNQETEMIDYDELEKKAKEVKPKMIIAGASSYPRLIDYERMAEIAKEACAYLMVDMAHIAGLVAAGVIPSPIPYADFVSSSTTKTFL